MKNRSFHVCIARPHDFILEYMKELLCRFDSCPSVVYSVEAIAIESDLIIISTQISNLNSEYETMRADWGDIIQNIRKNRTELNSIPILIPQLGSMDESFMKSVLSSKICESIEVIRWTMGYSLPKDIDFSCTFFTVNQEQVKQGAEELKQFFIQLMTLSQQKRA